VADKDSDKDPDKDSNPGTEPFVPEFDETGEHSVPFVPTWDDTGEHSVPFVPNWDDTGSQPIASPAAATQSGEEPQPPAPAASEDGEAEPGGAPVQSVTVPGRYQYLKWWKLILVVLGVWAAAALVGLGLFSWWFHTVDKTPALFMVLVYVVASAVVGVMLAMVQSRPVIAALSIAMMTAPFASVVAAAPLYGYYDCTRTGHCLIGVIPY
jgi:hypothetical protein